MARVNGMITLALVVLFAFSLVPVLGTSDSRQQDTPIIIGHRGASGERPEHTIAAYKLAIEQGAHFIEPDLVSTKDGVLVARHENEISGTTDVADHPEFANRRVTKIIDGVSVTGWFTEDFTLAELKTLRAKERLPQLRPENTKFDGEFKVPTLQEVLDLVKQVKEETGRSIGVYPETKHPTYFDSIGLSMEEPLVHVLHNNAFLGPNAPIYIQSFEVGNLQDLSQITELPLVQLLNDNGAPFDFVAAGNSRTYADMITPAGLAETATYAQGIGVNKNLIIPRDSSGALLPPTSLVSDAHAAGLIVHTWTFRAENTFLPANFQVGDPADPDFPAQHGDLEGEITLFMQQGMDGFFTDFPEIGVEARDAFLRDDRGDEDDDEEEADQPTLTHGIASGDVTENSAIIWARSSGPGQMHVEYGPSSSRQTKTVSAPEFTDASTDLTAQIKLTDLRPGTLYRYEVWFTSPEEASENDKDGDDDDEDDENGDRDRNGAIWGSFYAAPGANGRANNDAREIRFVWGGDLGGQQHCRQVGRGYDIFNEMAALEPHFFIANGDMIYADGDCPAEGPDGPGGWQNIPGDFPSIADSSIDWTDTPLVEEIFRKHWRYNRNDPHFQHFLRHVPMYSQWDDHEVINDFGAQWGHWNSANASRPGFPNIVEAGRNTVFDYSPIDRHPGEPDRIYRSFNWGRDLDLFILDARSYRSRNDVEDTPANNKTLLGAAQLAWLKQGLQESDATWKVVSSDVPMSAPTGSNASMFGRDSWANGTASDFSADTGFERELLDLMSFLDENNIKNVVFVTTDVHWATSIAYSVDVDGDGDNLELHEFVTGPINAVRGNPGPLDPTLNPDTLYAEGGIFNFGYARIVEVAGKPHLRVDVRDETGTVRPGSEVDLTPQ